MLGLVSSIQDLDGVIVLTLRFVDDGDVVLDFQRVRHNRVGLLQRVQSLIKLAVAAIDFGDAHISLRV